MSRPTHVPRRGTRLRGGARRSLLLLTGIYSLAGMAHFALADAAARAIIEKALQASDGKEGAAPPKALHSKLKGRAWINDAWHPVTVEAFLQLPGQLKTVLRCELKEGTWVLIQVANGDRAWRSENGQTQESRGPALTELQEGVYDQRVGLLFPLLDEKRFTLSITGPSTVNDRPAIGVKVSSPGHEAIVLSFDKATGLLAKSERRTPDLTGKEIFRETLFGYKTLNGKPELATMVIYQDRVKILEAEITAATFPEKIDESEFARP